MGKNEPIRAIPGTIVIEISVIQQSKRYRGVSQVITIYDADAKYQFLKQSDVIGVEHTKDREGDQVLVKLTHKRQELAKDLLKMQKDDPMWAHYIEQQVGRNMKPNELIEVYEFKKIYRWQVEGK